MTRTYNAATSSSTAPQTLKSNYTSSIFRIFTSICAITLAVFVLLHSMGMQWSQTGIHILSSFVYSALIALPSMFLLQWVSIRYTYKFPRLIILMRASILLFTAIAGCLAATFALQLIGVMPRGVFWREFQSSVEFAIVISLIIGMSTAAFETLRYKLQAAQLELRNKQVEQERAYKLLAEAQLSSLESRIHPHFLFNTLNSISALIPRDPQLAEDTVGKLASLLRFSLGANHSSLVFLSQELKIVREYLEIEKTRFGDRLSYSIEVPEEIQDVKVPPLAIQSLVENAVKHVVSQRRQGATIQVSGAEESSLVRLSVVDDGPGFSLEAIHPDHGLGNLIARLDLLFGNEGRLDVTRENGKTVVSLSFPRKGRA
jgi:sensor histidine kinase YesM